MRIYLVECSDSFPDKPIQYACSLACVRMCVCVRVWVSFKQKSHTLNSMGILFYWIWLIDEREKLEIFFFWLHLPNIFKHFFFSLHSFYFVGSFYFIHSNPFKKHGFCLKNDNDPTYRLIIYYAMVCFVYFI